MVKRIGNVSNLELIRKHDGNHVYSGTMNSREVVVKIVTELGMPHFERELHVLKDLKHPNIVELIECGDTDLLTPKGKYFVLEKANIEYSLEDSDLELLVKDLVKVLWYLASNNVYWVCRKEHVGVVNGKLKIFDFNDDTPAETGFVFFRFEDYFDDRYEHKNSPFNVVSLIRRLLKDNNVIIDIKKLIIEDYQSLENVHQEIPIDGLRDTLRRESEKGDPNYGKLVPANRLCNDRLEMLLSHHPKEWWRGKSVLDIGCNVGWFCFELNRLGARCRGRDADKRKARFAESLSWWVQQEDLEFVAGPLTPKPGGLEFYDVILAFSVLHRLEGPLIKDFNYNRDYLERIITMWWSKTKHDLVLELPVPFIHTHFGNGFQNYLKGLGAGVKILGKSDNKRDLYCCSRGKK